MIKIIIPVWNLLSCTRTAIYTIQSNSNPHEYEIIVIDNGSTDGTGLWLKQNNIEHITNKSNLGVTVAWNQGLEAALNSNASTIALLNNDIYVGKYWLNGITNAINENRKAYFLANGAFDNPTTLNSDIDNHYNNLKGKRTYGRAGWAMFFPRKAVEIFYPIPPQLILWHGDDYIHDTLYANNYICEVVMECCIIHFGSQTFYTYPDYVKQVATDLIEWNKYRTTTNLVPSERIIEHD